MPSEDPPKVRSWYHKCPGFRKQLVITLLLDFTFNFSERSRMKKKEKGELVIHLC